MLRNMLQPDRPQMIYREAHTLCMLDKYKAKHTHTHRICNTHFFSTPTMLTQNRLNNASSLLYYPPFIHHGLMFCDTKTPEKVEECRKQKKTHRNTSNIMVITLDDNFSTLMHVPCIFYCSYYNQPIYNYILQ